MNGSRRSVRLRRRVRVLEILVRNFERAAVRQRAALETLKSGQVEQAIMEFDQIANWMNNVSLAAANVNRRLRQMENAALVRGQETGISSGAQKRRAE